MRVILFGRSRETAIQDVGVRHQGDSSSVVEADGFKEATLQAPPEHSSTSIREVEVEYEDSGVTIILRGRNPLDTMTLREETVSGQAFLVNDETGTKMPLG